MKETPKGWPRLSTAVYYDDAPAAIDWLCRALDFEIRLKVEGDAGQIVHSELTYGEAVVMVAASGSKPSLPLCPPGAAPKSIGGKNTQNLMLYVDSVDAHHQRVIATGGATIVDPPRVHDYGGDYWADKSYGFLDPEGHMWWISERLRNPGE